MKFLPSVLLVASLFTLISCDEAQKTQRDDLAREAADYVADVARRDPERAGKVGVWRGLHVRAQALGQSRDLAHRQRFDLIAPTCRPILIPPHTLELIDVHIEVHGKRAFSWQQRIATTHHAGAERMIIDERYTDDETILPGERFSELIWSSQERWMRSARAPSARFVKDAYPERAWHTFSTTQRAGMESLITLVDAWKVEGDRFVLAEDSGDSFGCLRSDSAGEDTHVLDELKDVLAMSRGRVQQATIEHEELEGVKGWRVSVTWGLGERGELKARIWRGRRPMTPLELDEWTLPQRAMEATQGQGEPLVLPNTQLEEVD